MKKSLPIIVILIVFLFANIAKAQIPNQSLQYFSVLTEGNLINNNPHLIKGIVGVNGNLTGTYANSDSVLGSTSTELSEALTELSELKTYLNSVNGTTIDSLMSEMSAGVYSITSAYESTLNQTIKFIGNSTDTIVINVNGNFIINESTNFVLQGILPENIYWNINGTLKIKRRCWVYGTFFTTGEVIIYNDVEGAISTFSEADITLGVSDIFTSNQYLTISNDVHNQVACFQPCIEYNLVANGDFNYTPNCVNTPNANGFNSDLIYKISNFSNFPCFNPESTVGYYKIDNGLNSWNGQCINTISDHTGNGSNLLFIDAFRFLTDNQGVFTEDTAANLLWGQTIYNIEPGKDYLFYFWSTNINLTHYKPLKTRVLFNGIELPNTRYSVPGKIVQWAQHCIVWTAPGTLGGATFNLNIEIKQVDDFTSSGSGQDVVFDDIAFGKRGSIPIQITSTETSNYCLGSNTTLSVVNPNAGYTYQWVFNGTPIIGATNNTYVATISGNYSVIGLLNQVCLLSSNILPITINALSGENTNFIVSGNNTQTWTVGATSNPFASIDGTVWIKYSLTIPSGKNITIKGMRFEFGPEAVVIIQAGATLTLEKDGTTPTIFTSYNCPNTMWEGVKIASTISSKGIFVIKESCILENARIGVNNYANSDDIRVEYNGYITASGAIFRNNFIAVKLESKNSKGANTPRLNSSSFINCEFITTANMKDQTTYADGKHKTFVDLTYINGVRFLGNTFKNSIHPSHPSFINNVFDEAKVTRNKGITSLNSSFKMESTTANTFTNLWVGIDYSNVINTSSNQTFNNVVFGSDAYGIILRGGNGIKVTNCTFNIDPSYATGSVKVPKSFIGINARGSVGYSFEYNQFANGYCGIVSKSSGAKNIYANIYGNTFSDMGKKSKGKGQGVYALGQNQPLQVKCNTFISSTVSDIVQNHWVSDGLMNTQGYCDPGDNSAPANNIFLGYSPINADIYAKQPESGFIYNTQNTSVASIMPLYKEGTANMTSVYVNNCNGTYIPEEACYGGYPPPINEILDGINTAISNEDDVTLTQLLTYAVQYYEKEDSTGESTITFLNETPHAIAKWMLVAKYLQSDEYSQANDVLEILSTNTEEEEAEKQFYQLLIQLENEDASLLELSQSATDQLTELAELEYAVSYEAQGILHNVNGNAYYIPLPYEEESERPIFNADTTTSTISDLSIYPNPTNNYITISNPNNIGIDKVEVQNMSGATILSVEMPKSNIINVESIANGMYLVVIHIKTGEKTIKKLVITK